MMSRITVVHLAATVKKKEAWHKSSCCRELNLSRKKQQICLTQEEDSQLHKYGGQSVEERVRV